MSAAPDAPCASQQHTTLHAAQQLLRAEAACIQALAERLTPVFSEVCHLLVRCKGRVLLSGLGKSGHIARKIAATLSSLGTPACFVHPTEANHGDSGLFVPGDVALLCSYSGSAPELISLLPRLHHLRIPCVALTGNTSSPLARSAQYCLEHHVPREACALNLAPTSSTTTLLALGDALAVCVSQLKGVCADDFAARHPAGQLGKRLLLRVDDVMHTGAQMPCMSPEDTLLDALVLMSRKPLGITAITTSQNELLGVFTDGDLRRALLKNPGALHDPLHHHMTPRAHHVPPGTLLASTLSDLHEHRISVMLVVDAHSKLRGMVTLQDILDTGLLP